METVICFHVLLPIGRRGNLSYRIKYWKPLRECGNRCNGDNGDRIKWCSLPLSGFIINLFYIPYNVFFSRHYHVKRFSACSLFQCLEIGNNWNPQEICYRVCKSTQPLLTKTIFSFLEVKSVFHPALRRLYGSTTSGIIAGGKLKQKKVLAFSNISATTVWHILVLIHPIYHAEN